MDLLDSSTHSDSEEGSNRNHSRSDSEAEKDNHGYSGENSNRSHSNGGEVSNGIHSNSGEVSNGNHSRSDSDSVATNTGATWSMTETNDEEDQLQEDADNHNQTIEAMRSIEEAVDKAAKELGMSHDDVLRTYSRYRPAISLDAAASDEEDEEDQPPKDQVVAARRLQLLLDSSSEGESEDEECDNFYAGFDKTLQSIGKFFHGPDCDIGRAEAMLRHVHQGGHKHAERMGWLYGQLECNDKGKWIEPKGPNNSREEFGVVSLEDRAIWIQKIPAWEKLQMDWNQEWWDRIKSRNGLEQDTRWLQKERFPNSYFYPLANMLATGPASLDPTHNTVSDDDADEDSQTQPHYSSNKWVDAKIRDCPFCLELAAHQRIYVGKAAIDHATTSNASKSHDTGGESEHLMPECLEHWPLGWEQLQMDEVSGTWTTWPEAELGDSFYRFSRYGYCQSLVKKPIPDAESEAGSTISGDTQYAENNAGIDYAYIIANLFVPLENWPTTSPQRKPTTDELVGILANTGREKKLREMSSFCKCFVCPVQYCQSAWPITPEQYKLYDKVLTYECTVGDEKKVYPVDYCKAQPHFVQSNCVPYGKFQRHVSGCIVKWAKEKLKVKLTEPQVRGWIRAKKFFKGDLDYTDGELENTGDE